MAVSWRLLGSNNPHERREETRLKITVYAMAVAAGAPTRCRFRRRASRLYGWPIFN